ncbi:DUF2407 ubiquitin-like domain [Seminavis robusta]|uniref:DUF2407 ubiquitin-like domain n=1 Tax=Seminavis robusta TaxID=568900 RepID=A0A9N8DGD0_9STRA|nr:DUF2407 ubiquitin-like domain [Seminavis robusta]|eukprot:Sro79_g042690.1 DUF2407 ubiquitin-like domain (325) ;mRNA; r:40977-41951
MLRSTTNEDNDPLLGGKDNHDDTLLSGTSNSSNNESGMNLALRIKSFKDVEIRINDASSVSQVKEAVRNALGEQADDRYLRLICKGRLLAPDTSALREFSVRNGDVLHAVLAAAGVRGGQQAALARGISRRYRGTGVGAGGRAVRAGADSDDDDDNNNGDSADEEEGRERIGFDRLRSTGLSRSEIAAIRSYFSRNVDRYVQAHPEVASEANESDNRRRRLLQEDAWMQAQGPTSEFRFNLNQNNPFLRFSSDTPLFRATTVGTDRDFLWGFLLGFFVGFLMLVWVWMPTVPHKQKLGILTGISFQLAMNFMKDNPDDAEFVED